ncbi:MAG: hypothetical protein O6929_07865 [candidate division NC10 bacterium]|nr:hypothetical protein [candidate division NC10 bacterium]
MRNPLRGMAGLTLPEVLLATVIITVGILGVVGLFPTALQNIQYGGHMSQASSLAQAMIERIRTEPFGTVFKYHDLDTRNEPPSGLPASVLAHFTQWTNNIAPASPSGALPQGRGTIAVATVPGLPDLLRVTVTVTWQERGSQTITFVTYVARYGWTARSI